MVDGSNFLFYICTQIESHLLGTRGCTGFDRQEWSCVAGEALIWSLIQVKKITAKRRDEESDEQLALAA